MDKAEKKELFKLCKKRKLTVDEEQRLINNPDLRNQLGESLLFNYTKNQGNDTVLMQKMLDGRHDINNICNQGHSMLHRCISFSASEKMKDSQLKKILWLIEKKCPIKTSVVDPIEHFLDLYFNIVIGPILEAIYITYPELEKDLTKIEYRNRKIAFKCTSLRDILWMDSHFNLNYSTEGDNYELEQLIKLDNMDLFQFIVNKIMDDKSENRKKNIDALYWACMFYGSNLNMEMLYKFGYIDSAHTKAMWTSYSQNAVKCNRFSGGSNICCDGYCRKTIVLWGQSNNKFEKEPFLLIDRMKITNEDRQLFKKGDYKNIHCTFNY
jgi:hypothetical protein